MNLELVLHKLLWFLLNNVQKIILVRLEIQNKKYLNNIHYNIIFVPQLEKDRQLKINFKQAIKSIYMWQ